MMEYLVFNELSLPFKTKQEAVKGLSIFVRTFAAASAIGLNQLRLHKKIGKNLHHLEVAPGCFIYSILGSIEDDDIKNRFKEITTYTPLITEGEPIVKEKNERSSFELFPDGKNSKIADGLGAAYLMDTIALSFLSISAWNTPTVDSLKHYLIREDGTDSVTDVSVRHASTPGHIAQHTDWIQSKRLQGFTAAKDLWDKRHTFFPHLILCGQVEQQLKAIGIGSSFFRQIFEHLKLLDTFAGEWTTGGFNNKALKQYGLNVSGESEQTMQKYGRLRKFRLPNRRNEYFEKHIKTGALRFHFYADCEEHKIYVGYIGSHLPTVTN